MLKLSKLYIASAAFLAASITQADETLLCPSTINQSIDENVTLIGSGTCTLAAGVEITGEVKVEDGTSFVIKGMVDGKVDEVGEGRIVVNGGAVFNDIIETDVGGVRLVNGALVTGKIDESGAGGVLVDNSDVENDVLESGGGRIAVINGSNVAGSLDEAGNGSVTVDASSMVDGNVFEEDAGNCDNVVASSVEGEIECD